jgi:hypothetical protein
MDPATVPSPIVARALALAAELERWAREHRRATLEEHERGVLAIVRRFMGPALAAVVAGALGLDRPVARRLREACPDCGARRRPHAWRARQLLTVCGAVRLERPYYYCPACRRGRCPADEALGLGAYAATSPGCAEWLALVGALGPFRPAAELLERLTGLGVGAETVRRHAEAAGGLLDLCRRAAAEQVEREREPAGALEEAVGILVVQADGVLVRYLDGWHEVKLGLVSGCEPGRPARGPAAEGRPHALLGPSYVAARAPADEFGPLLLAEAARRGALEVVGWEPAPGDDPALPRVPPLAVLREVVVLGDGASWIWGLAAEHFGHRTEIVDWYHASEHLWALARALHREGTPEAAAWAKQAHDLLWDEGAGPLLRLLAETRAGAPEAAEALRLARGYVAANAARMDYPAFRARGLPVGSGAVEAAAKHLVQARLKRAGMRWSHDGAQAILALCADLATERARRRVA